MSKNAVNDHMGYIMETGGARRYTGIDVLRILFCFGIVFYHVSDLFQAVPARWAPFLCRYGGYFGNDFFFMASGLFTAYHHRAEIPEKRLWQFLLDRIRKIYPFYLISTAAVLFIGGTEITLSRIITSVFLVSTGWLDGTAMPLNFPAWFLCVLMICCLWYFLIGKLSARFPRLYLPLCGFLAVWGLVLQIMNWEIPLNYRTCGEGYLNFFLGVLLAELFDRSSLSDSRLALGGCSLLAALALGCALAGFDTVFGACPWVISLLCACLICAAKHHRVTERLAWIPQSLPEYCSMLLFLWHIPPARGFLVFQQTGAFVQRSPGWAFLLYLLVLILFSGIQYLLTFSGEEQPEPT